jgi:PAS domain S-box-containing protein
VIGKTLEFLAIKKDGTRFSIEISTSVINLRGKWEAVGIIRDVTERKLDEKTLRQYAELLFKDVNLNNGPA